MKKSNMLEIIEDAISPCNSTYKDSRVRTSARILKVIEEAGMLPPTVRLELFDVMDNTWESEDE